MCILEIRVVDAIYALRDWRFSQQLIKRLQSSGMWHHVICQIAAKLHNVTFQKTIRNHPSPAEGVTGSHLKFIQCYSRFLIKLYSLLGYLEGCHHQPVLLSVSLKSYPSSHRRSVNNPCDSYFVVSNPSLCQVQ
jgi:hypothetical protein